MRKAIAVPAAVIACLAAAALAAAPLARYEAEKKAAEAGYRLEAGGTKMGLWNVVLEDVRLSGPSVDMTAREVKVGYDWHLRLTSVKATGADATLKKGGERAKGRRAGERPELSVEDSIVRAEEGGTRAEARIQSARIDREGKVWAKADVEVTRGQLSVSAKGLRAEGVQPGAAMEVEVRDLKVRRTDREDTRAEGPRQTTELPTVMVSAETASFEGYGIVVQAEDVEAEVERTKAGEKLAFSAMNMKSSGARAAGVSVRVQRTDVDEAAVKVSAEYLETEDSRLSSAEFSLRKLQVEATLERKDGKVEVRFGTAKLGTARADFSASVSPLEFKALVEVPEVDCQRLMDSLPTEMVPRVQKSELAGTFQWRTEVYVDLPLRKRPDISMWMKNRCVVKRVPEDLDVKLLRKPFWREVYSAGGEKKRELAGPGTPAWTPLSSVSQFMPMAVMAMEDPSFMSHRGIVLQAIENSMEQNIAAGKFVRGGSTISMQLAKNLWLAREKTISRKVQEAFLTTYLEQSLTKAQMIELYLNIVEFGPNLYGIGPAAKHYFAKDPSTLTLSQSLFLASLLPSPKSSGYEEGKQVSSGRLGLLRKVMKMMLDRGTINGAQYEQGLKETPVFGEPSPMGGAEEVTSQEGIDPSEWR